MTMTWQTFAVFLGGMMVGAPLGLFLAGLIATTARGDTYPPRAPRVKPRTTDPDTQPRHVKPLPPYIWE